jgi:regulator of RNase E activity RraA
MPDAAPLSDRSRALLAFPSTATLTTVLSKQGLWNTFVTGAGPLNAIKRMIGVAYTLRYIPSREDLDHDLVFDNSSDPQRIAIEAVGPGDVLVIDARGDQRAGTMGNILAARMVARGAVGIVTDGCFRDSPAIAAMEIAAYSRSPHASTNKTIHHPIEVQVPIGCGGVAVYPGDVLVGDQEGVVVIPATIVDKVAELAADQEHREDFILSRVVAGNPLLGTYPPDEQTTAAYELYCQQNPKPSDSVDS